MQEIATIDPFGPQQQRRGRALVTGASATVQAPARLRENVARLECQRRRSRRRGYALRGLALAGGLVVAAAAVAL